MASLQVAQRPPLLTSLSRKPIRGTLLLLGETLQKLNLETILKKEKRIFFFLPFFDVGKGNKGKEKETPEV